jgi:hypothetical protein
MNMKSTVIKTLPRVSIPQEGDTHSGPSLISRLNAFADLATANIWELAGLIGPDSVQLTLLFAGSEVQKHFLVKHIFHGQCIESYRGKLILPQVLALIRKSRSRFDLAIIEGDYFHKLCYQSKDDFFVPLWLKSYAEIPLKVMNRSAKEDLRRARSNNLTYTITRDKQAFDDFYHRMYLPYVQLRHQESTIPMGYEEMMHSLQQGNCELLLVLKGTEAIAGLLILRDSSIPRLWSIGLKDGNQVHWKEGAVAAAYNFASMHLAQAGCSQMHMGLMRSFYRDGIFQNKKKWGITVAASSSAGFIIKPFSKSEGLVQFFLNNPFVFCREEQLCSAIFVKEEMPQTAEEIDRLSEFCDVRGVEALELFPLPVADGSRPTAPSNVLSPSV